MSKSAKLEYLERLKDPRWQKKRLEIFERDGWCCQKCFDENNTLNVHHKLYKPNLNPWEYEDDLLITLCDECHQTEMENMEKILGGMEIALQSKFLSDDVSELSIAIYTMQLQHNHDVVAGAISWAISDNEMQSYIIDSYFKHLRKKSTEKKAMMENTNGKTT